MNITNDSAGSVSQKHILSKGFSIFRIAEINDMGQATYELPQYRREDGVMITGGYWSYNIENKNGDVLFCGWWNSDEEFDETMIHIDYLLKYQPYASKLKELQVKYDKLHSATKEYMSKDLSLNAMEFRIHFDMMIDEDINIIRNEMRKTGKIIETSFGMIEMFKHPILDND